MTEKKKERKFIVTDKKIAKPTPASARTCDDCEYNRKNGAEPGASPIVCQVPIGSPACQSFRKNKAEQKEPEVAPPFWMREL